MTGPIEDAWEYLKRAPLGVVLAVSLVCTGFSVAYTAKVTSSSAEAAEQAKDKAVTAEQKAAVAAASDAATLAALERVERALQKLATEVAVMTVLTQQHLEEAKAAKPKR